MSHIFHNVRHTARYAPADKLSNIARFFYFPVLYQKKFFQNAHKLDLNDLIIREKMFILGFITFLL